MRSWRTVHAIVIHSSTCPQYDVPEDVPPPAMPEQRRRWRQQQPSRSRSRSRSRSEERSRRRARSVTSDSSTTSSRSRSRPRPSPPRRSSRSRSRSVDRGDRPQRRRRQSRDQQHQRRDPPSALHRPEAAHGRIESRHRASRSPRRPNGRPLTSGGDGYNISDSEQPKVPQRDRKGKGRALDDHRGTTPNAPFSSHDAPHTQSPLQIAHTPTHSPIDAVIQSAETTSTVTSNMPKVPPKIRNRGLLESVHAHLAPRPRPREARHVPQQSQVSAHQPSMPTSANEKKGATSHILEIESRNPGRPSLLERLSDSPSFPPSSSQSTGPSTPGDLPTTLPVDDPSTSQVLQARAKLLSRLADEKRLHESSELPCPPDDASRLTESITPERPTSSDGASVANAMEVPASTSTAPAQEAADKEAKLRSQALLRVRLAAAKKAAGAQITESVQSIRTEDILSKEQILKARLMQRRT